eukprot:COSAG03_NODE_12984_length_522_cov_26.484634_2_plen_46_part_01
MHWTLTAGARTASEVYKLRGVAPATWYSMQLMAVTCPAGVYAGSQI